MAILFSQIHNLREKQHPIAIKKNGGVRTVGGVAIQLLKRLPQAKLLFGRGRMDLRELRLALEQV